MQIEAKVSGPSNGHDVAKIIDVDQADPESKPNYNIAETQPAHFGSGGATLGTSASAKS